MRVCGVELKNNEAIICLLAKSDGLFDIPDCRVKRITLRQVDSREELQDFQKTFMKLMEDYKIERVVIKERHLKGKFVGGAIGFKLEAAIQLIPELDVELMNAADIKLSLSDNPVPVSFADTGLKAFQEPAFITAYANIMKSEDGANYYGTIIKPTE